jgi:hypothetical protein
LAIEINHFLAILLFPKWHTIFHKRLSFSKVGVALDIYFIYFPNKYYKGLKDRILIYYHNISLFDDECNVKKVYLDSKENICEYKFKAFLENSIISSRIIFI